MNLAVVNGICSEFMACLSSSMLARPLSFFLYLFLIPPPLSHRLLLIGNCVIIAFDVCLFACLHFHKMFTVLLNVF